MEPEKGVGNQSPEMKEKAIVEADRILEKQLEVRRLRYETDLRDLKIASACSSFMEIFFVAGMASSIIVLAAVLSVFTLKALGMIQGAC